MFYKVVFKRYVVVGGLAVNLQVVPRFTKDIDIIIDMEEKNIVKCIEALQTLHYKPRVPVNPFDFAKADIRERWVREKKMIVFSFFDAKEPFWEIDIVMQQKIPFDKIQKSVEYVKSEGIKIPVISIDNLILMKKEALRKQDVSDIESLKKLKRIRKNDKKKKK